MQNDELGKVLSSAAAGVTPELTSLHEAIQAKDLERVNKLLREGKCDVNHLHPNFDWGFPLGHAYEVKDRRIVRALLKAGANPNTVEALSSCIVDNDLPLARLLIKHGVDPDGQPTWEKDEHFETNLIKATRLGRYAFVKLLIEAGADPNRHDGNNESALFVARMNNSKRLVKLLERYVSDEERAWVDERHSEAYAELLVLDKKIWIAIHSGEVEKTLELIKSTRRPLDRPLQPNHGCILEEALRAYVTAVGHTRPKRTATDGNEWRRSSEPDYLHPQVVIRRSLVEKLVKMGAPADKGGWMTPLAYLDALSDRVPELELGMMLIQNASDVDAPINSDGETALMSAVSGWGSYRPAFVEALLKRGANPNARNRHGVTVLQKARSQEKFNGPNPCIELLLEAGAEEQL